MTLSNELVAFKMRGLSDKKTDWFGGVQKGV
jgi:hypothetical protein